MATKRDEQRRLLPAVVCVLGLLPLGGCGGSAWDCAPVGGTVTVDGQSLDGGYVVVFNPDASKGNTVRAACLGRVNNGRYEIASSGVNRSEKGAGAPLGWYKVSLEHFGSTSNPFKDKSGNRQTANVPKMYLNSEKTPLEIEVVANPKPGAYDLQLKSR